MRDFLTIGAAVVSAVVVLCTVLYGQAQINQQVQDLAELERRVEQKVDHMSGRVEWLYGYHRINGGGHHDNLTKAPIAMPRLVPSVETSR